MKEHLHSNGITYRDLSERLGVAELTVKRQLNSDDLSLCKLLALCEAAELGFGELWAQVENDKPQHFFFNSEQDEAFYQHPGLFRFFLELFTNGKSLDQVQEAHQLSDASLHLYLRKLECLKLLQLSAKGRVTFTLEPPVGFASDSKVLRSQLASVISQLNDQLQNGEAFQRFLVSKPLKLPLELQEKFFDEIVATVSRYSELSEKYFFDSEHDVLEFFACEFAATSVVEEIEIPNTTGFD